MDGSTEKQTEIWPKPWLLRKMHVNAYTDGHIGITTYIHKHMHGYVCNTNVHVFLYTYTCVGGYMALHVHILVHIDFLSRLGPGRRCLR